jgi:hypothetical protein
MEAVKVEKAKLLEILRKNRTTHRGVFELAQDGYRKEAVRVLEEQLDRAKAGKPFKPQWTFTQPVDQTEDYDRAIEMLEMSVDDVIELSEDDFRCYVQDKWRWKGAWAISNKLYTPEALWAGDTATLPGNAP